MQALINTIADGFREWYEFVVGLWAIFIGFLSDPVWILNELWKFIIECCYMVTNEILNIIAILITTVSGWLPEIWPQTMMSLDNIPARWLEALNWAIPFDHFAAAISILIVSTFSWASIGIVFRWLKVFS